jgi:hypothetical protein
MKAKQKKLYLSDVDVLYQSLEGFMKKHSGDLHSKHYLNLIGKWEISQQS